MRNFAAAAVLSAALLPTVTPASAEGAGIFDCDVTYWTYGAGPTSGSGPCTFYGTTIAAARITFSAHIPASSCPTTESANGSLSGAGFTITFNWTRVGNTGIVTTGGNINGGGSAVFVNSTATGGCGSTNYRVRVILFLAGT